MILTIKGKFIKEYENELNDIDPFIAPRSKWILYILKCNDESLYTGITTDIKRRLHEHNHSKCGAKYTRSRRPVKLVYYEQCTDRVDASRKEYKIKKLSRKEKLNLCDI